MMRLRIVPEKRLQESVRITAGLDDLARPRLPAPGIGGTPGPKGAFSPVLQEPLAADVKALSRHAETSVSAFYYFGKKGTSRGQMTAGFSVRTRGSTRGRACSKMIHDPRWTGERCQSGVACHSLLALNQTSAPTRPKPSTHSSTARAIAQMEGSGSENSQNNKPMPAKPQTTPPIIKRTSW